MDIQEIVAGIGSSQALQDVAGKLGLDPADAQSILHGVLVHMSNGGSTEGMVEAVAAKAGVDPATVQQFLPQVMPLLQAHAANAGEGVQGVQGVLGGLIGSMGGMLGGSSSGGGLAGLAKGLFG